MLLWLSFSLEAKEDDTSLDLLTIFSLAEKNDPGLSSARFENQAAQELLPQGKALFLPTIVVNANINQNNVNRISETSFDNNMSYLGSNKTRYQNYGYGVLLRQPIINFENYIQYQQNVLRLGRSDKQLLLKKQELMQRVTQLYFDMLLVKDQINLFESQKKAVQQQLILAQAKFDAGIVSVADVNEAKTKLALIEAQIIGVNQSLNIKKREIQTIIGNISFDIKSLRMDIQFAKTNDNLEKWQSIALINNLQIQTKQDEYQLAQNDIELKKTGHYPILNAIASSRENSVTGGFPYSNSVKNEGDSIRTDVIGLELTIPIYSGGLTSSQVRESLANSNKVQEDLEFVKKQVDFNIKQHYSNMEAYFKQINAYGDTFEAAYKQLESSELGFKEGFRNSIEVLNAQQTLFNAEKDLFGAKYNYLMSIVNLKYFSGLIKDADLLEINQFLIK
jgi:outer membrane protein